MGDILLKRQRDIEEEEEEQNANPIKMHKNCNNDNDDGGGDQIVRSLLEVNEEKEPHQNHLSSLMTTLEQELYSDHHHFNTAASSDMENPTPSSSANSAILDDDRDSVIRHLLEASDDELGIPDRVVAEEDENIINISDYNSNINGGGDSSVCSVSLGVEGLWELEDEAANYYTLLQSELFL